jgi:outer membrane protein OmpA-like peptidoglycan-associated protein
LHDISAMILLLAALLQAAPPSPSSTIACPDGSVAPDASHDCPRFVFFDSGEAELSRDAEAELDKVAARLKELGGRLLLRGFSDRSGPPAANVRVSLERAELVRQSLIARGLQPAAIRVEALGESQPLIATADGVREPQNRRVEISFEPR